MKRALFLLAALCLCVTFVPSANAQIVVGLSTIDVNPETTSVEGYSATLLDYNACYYYDAYVEGYLYEDVNGKDSDAFHGICTAEAFTDTLANPGHIYTEIGDHYIVAYFYDAGFGFYDPFGFSNFGGEYGGSYNFNGCNCATYYFEEYIYLGSTIVSIELEPPCNKVPTLTVSPNPVTRSQQATFTLDPANLCSQRTIQNWFFTDGARDRITVRKSLHPGSTSWSGLMVANGSVTVTVTQGGHTYSPHATVTVSDRQGNFPSPVPTPERRSASTPPFDCRGTPITFVTPPRPGQALGKSCLLPVDTPTPGLLNDNGPNHGYTFVTSIDHTGSNYVYFVHPELEDPTTAFFRAQCGDFDPATNTGFVSGARLVELIAGHEAGPRNSHFQEYADALRDPQKNIGAGLEEVVSAPDDSPDTFSQTEQRVINERASLLSAAASVEPCGFHGQLNENCMSEGVVNTDRDANNVVHPFFPCRPKSLSANAFASHVDLTWIDQSSNEVGFSIERLTGGQFVPIATVATDGVSYSDTSVMPSTDYTYRVLAFSSPTTPSFDSNHLTVHTPAAGGGGTGAPAPPTGPAAAAASSSQIVVSWVDASSNEDGFKVERRTGSGLYSQIATVGANVTSYADASVAPSTSYTYRVRAYNISGDSPYSGEIGATTPAASPSAPIAPSSLASNGISSTQVILSWADNSNNETGFKIERRTGIGSYSQIATVGANVTSYSDNSVVGSTPYSYRVRATNATGDSAYSNELGVTTPGNGPIAPSNLVATGISSTQVNLSWVDHSANESGFKIERRTGSGSYAQIGTVGINVTGYIDTSVSSGVSYTYRVKAYNAAGDSGYSNEASVTTVFPTLPAPPSNLSAVVVSISRVDLAWTDNSYDESGFKIERSTGNGAFIQIATVPANVTSYSDTSVAPFTTYSYRLRTYTASGDSTYCNWATVSTPTAPGAGPAAPCCLSGYAGGGSGGPVFVSLTWADRSSDETGFVVERKEGNGSWYTVAYLPADSTSLGDSTAAPSTAYSYRVGAYNSTGKNYSGEFPVVTPDP